MKAVLRGSNSHRSTRILVLSALVVKSPLARSSDRLGPDSSGKPIRSSHARVPAGGRPLRAWHHHLTSNKSYRDSNSNLGDPIIATAILDRLLRPLATINIRRETYRLKDRRKVGLFPRAEKDSGRSAPFLSAESLQNGSRRHGVPPAPPAWPWLASRRDE